MCKQTIIELSRQRPNGQPIRNHLPKFIVTDCHEASLLEQTNLKMKINEFKYLRRLLNSAIILLSIFTLTIWLSSRSKPTLPNLEQYSHVQSSSELTSIPIKFSFIWSSTCDKILCNSTIPTRSIHHYAFNSTLPTRTYAF